MFHVVSNYGQVVKVGDNEIEWAEYGKKSNTIICRSFSILWSLSTLNSKVLNYLTGKILCFKWKYQGSNIR